MTSEPCAVRANLAFHFDVFQVLMSKHHVSLYVLCNSTSTSVSCHFCSKGLFCTKYCAIFFKNCVVLHSGETYVIKDNCDVAVVVVSFTDVLSDCIRQFSSLLVMLKKYAKLIIDIKCI